MSVSESVVDPVEETIELMALVPNNHFRLEPRCRVCRNDNVRGKVNNLLATGTSYAMVVRALGDDNAALDQCDRVTIDSVRNHCARHFPVQNVARATYREILERRAQENQVNFVDGVATAITPMAFLETVMAKSYGSLVDSETTVDVNTGILAASRLQSIIDSRAGQPNLLEIRVQLHRIINAVRSTVPHEMWADILQALNGTTDPVQTVDIKDFYDEVDDGEMVIEAAAIAELDDADEHDSSWAC